LGGVARRDRARGMYCEGSREGDHQRDKGANMEVAVRWSRRPGNNRIDSRNEGVVPHGKRWGRVGFPMLLGFQMPRHLDLELLSMRWSVPGKAKVRGLSRGLGFPNEA
jgi:hypothetical protein